MLSLQIKNRLLSILREDIAAGDITSSLLSGKKCAGEVICNANAILAGAEEATYLFRANGIKVKSLRKDGAKLGNKSKVMVVEGNNKKILAVERTAMNILGRMGGVATICNEAKKIAGKRVELLLTRKTMPGLNLFDKKACKLGGVSRHRLNLSEMFLIKNNHLEFDSITNLVKMAKKRIGKAKIKKVEVEAMNLRQAIEAAEAGADIIMLDNFSVLQAKEAIKEIGKRSRAKIELSGGIRLNNLKSYVKLRPDFISMGQLTKEATMVDFHLKVKK